MVNGCTGELRVLARLLAAALAAAGVLALVSSCTSRDESTLEVFAASSLTNAFADLAEQWQIANPSIEVRVTTAGSSSLREQLRDGAAADVFASANEAIVDELVDDGTIRAKPVVMAENQLVLAVPAGNPARVSGLGDLVDDSLLIGVCAPGVPCGDLARRLFDERGLTIAPDTEEPDVRSLTRRLAEGELDAALIYATDAVADADQIMVVDGGEGFASTRYPLVAVQADDPSAQAFVDFVLSEPGQAILLSWGFTPA